MSAPDPAWAAGIRRVHHDARGVLALDVVQRMDLPGVLLAALAGDADALQLARQVNDTLRRIQDAPAHDPMQCACCGAPLRDGRFAVVIAAPEGNPDARAALAMAICHRCGTTPGAITAAAQRALRCIWPDLRPATHTKGGRA